MDNQIWSFILTAVGLVGFYLAGKKIWWCWYVNIFNQVLWATYAFVTEQWGFLIGTGFYSAVFVNNAISWTKKHREKKEIFGLGGKPIGKVTSVSQDEDGLTIKGELTDEAKRTLRLWESSSSWWETPTPSDRFVPPSMNLDSIPNDPERCGFQSPIRNYPYFCSRPVHHEGNHGYAGVFWDNNGKPNELM